MQSLMLVAIWVGLCSQVAADSARRDEFADLEGRYQAAVTAHHSNVLSEDAIDAEIVRRHDALPVWEYLPKFLALAHANPEDQTALDCCQWIFDRCSQFGNQRNEIFEAAEAAWQLIAAHHTTSEQLPVLCLSAVQYPSPAREEFLRALPHDFRQSVEVHGFAFLALAELLAHKYESVLRGGTVAWPKPQTKSERYRQERIAAQWKEYMSAGNPEQIREESCDLFRHVLKHYSDIPIADSAPYFRDVNTLGQKAAKSLHALERLRVGFEAPPIAGTDLKGRPLRLSNYRGNVILLSFWFTGCGPCMEVIPEEHKLLEKYQDKGLVILGVCHDDDTATGQATTAEHDMTWPCLFDGETKRIHTDYNILHWPTFYLLDQQGKIAAKDVSPDILDTEIAKLLERQTGG